MIKLADLLRMQIESKVGNYHQSLLKPPISNEDDFIERTVQAFQNFSASGGGQSLKTRSVKVDKKPIVSFVPCPPLRSSRALHREIGDLLFVFKHFLRNKLDAHRASIVQTKYTSGTGKFWSIDTGQFLLMSYWPEFCILKPRKFSKTYDLRPKMLSWAIYGFVGPNVNVYPLYYSADRILRSRKFPSSKHFSFSLNSMPTIWVYSAGFLSKLLGGFIGENLFLNPEVKTLVDDLYKIAKLLPDPPGEFEWNNEEFEEGNNFGIIEFTITEQSE